MKTHMVQVREGENLGPIDWGYDFDQHDWNHGSDGGTNPVCVEQGKQVLRELVEANNSGSVSIYGEWRTVLDVGMYDGWPYWRPVPSVCISVAFGTEWHSFSSLRGFKQAVVVESAEQESKS